MERGRLAARRPETLVLGAIVLAGLALRAWLFVRWRPGFVGFPDTGVYVNDARTGVFNDPLRVAGYSEFLRLAHGIRAHLSFAIALQHVMGLASGLLLWAAMRRAGMGPWVSLVPAALVILSGSEIFVEHAALTEALFIFLVDLAVYATVRMWTGSWPWAILGGLAMGAAVDVRTVGLLVLPVMLAVFFAAAPGSWRRRGIGLAATLLAAALPIGWYLVEHQRTQGYGGFTGAGYFDLYARVAPFADCKRFTPPAGTANLCITIPRSRRPGHDVWEFTALSPAVRAFGEPDVTAAQHGENSKLERFAVAAVRGQPLDYLEAVGRDLVRIVDPTFASSPYGASGITGQGYGSGPEQLLNYYAVPTAAQGELNAYYPGDGMVHGDLSALRGYERGTRVEGPFMVVLLLLALLAPVLARGQARRFALFFDLTPLVLLVGPILVSEYDYRFTIPAFGPLGAAAAIGGAEIARRCAPVVRRRLRRRRPAPPEPA